MKKFLVSNILLSALGITASYYGVNNAFEATSVKYKKVVPTTFIKELKPLDFVTPADQFDIASIKIETKEENLADSITKKIKKIAKKSIPAKLIKKSQPKKVELKKNMIQPSTELVDLDLSFDEIEIENEYSVQSLHKVAFVDFATRNFDYSNIAKSDVNPNEDRISTVLAASEKSTSKKLNNTNNDELVFFDYDEEEKSNSHSEKVIGQNQVAKLPSIDEAMRLLKDSDESPSTGISIAKRSKNWSKQLGLKAISTMDKNSPKKIAEVLKNAPRVSRSGASVNNSNRKDEEVTPEPGPNPFLDKSVDYSCLNEKEYRQNSKVNEATYTLSLNSIDSSKKELDRVHNFEIRFQDDIDDIHQDFGEGEIDLKFKLSSHMNVRRGIVFAKSHYPTAIDLVIEPVSAQVSIPTFEAQTFRAILEKEELSDLGAHILVELDDSTEDVEIDMDTKYQGKLFLNEEFKVVDRGNSDFTFILFVGVQPGNTILNFKTLKGEVTSKIVHVTENEIYYEPNFYAELKKDKFDLYEQRLLSKCRSIKDVSTEKISTWSFEGKVKKQTLNKYSLSRMLYPLGTRKYIELSHLEENIYIGRWDETSVVIPSEDYISHVMSYFDLSGSDRQCVVQLNLRKKAKEVFFNGISKDGGMRMQINILDSDGNFYKDLSEQSEQIFLMGEEQGVINVKVDYTDGSSQYIQSYCSEATYLVEQL